MRERAFRIWLDQRLWAGQTLTKKAKDNRVRRTQRAERGLAGLGFTQPTLEAVFEEGIWPNLIVRLTQLKNDPGSDVAAVRSVVPQAEEPRGQLTNMIATLKQYGYFLEGRDPNYGDAGEQDDEKEALGLTGDAVEAAMLEYDRNAIDFMHKYDFSNNFDYVVFRSGEAARYPAKAIFIVAYSAVPGNPDLTGNYRNRFSDVKDGPIHGEFRRLGYEVENRRRAGKDEVLADRIREYVVANYFEPARKRGSPTVNVRSGDVHDDLGLTNQLPNVCQAIEGKQLSKISGLAQPEVVAGPPSGRGANMVYRFNLSHPGEKKVAPMTPPINLILYGPPGTGKTWITAAEAVHLCDGAVPDNRDELMTRYGQLVEARRIDFVTFHQNYSYEEFVEGLRPVTDSGVEAADATQAAGFRLEPKRGVFRELCAVAENARKNPGRLGGFDLNGRKLFKMSLGRAGVEDHIFDAAIEGSYVALGWGGDVDWSDQRYEQWNAILERWQEVDASATGNDPNVVQMWPFRTSIKPGDLVIVSAGNAHFRAIGEVTGPYSFEATGVNEYNHRRPVRWLLIPDEPLPAEMIYSKKFMMQSCYQLKDALVNKEALARLLPGHEASQSGATDQFVLIIDEINRANISKVFGELITLIEPDKRKGMPNALAVTLPYSGETFSVPANLHIIGTMNTADRSIALLDTALRRRFQFREMAPDPILLGEVDGIDLKAVLIAINQRIEYLIDREHRIGHAFFIGCETAEQVHAAMRDKVIPLLQEYFFEDWGRIAAVLGDGFIKQGMLDPPPGFDGEPLPIWSVRTPFKDDAFQKLIGTPPAIADGWSDAGPQAGKE